MQLDTYGRRAFAVVGPTVWNALGNDLRDPELSIASFVRLLKTLFQQYSVQTSQPSPQSPYKAPSFKSSKGACGSLRT